MTLSFKKVRIVTNQRGITMNYYIGKEKRPIEPQKYLGDGTEGRVFLDKNIKQAVKIFWEEESFEAPITLETALKMTNLKSNHILLPRNIVYDENNKFSGYTTKYIRTYPFITEDILNYYPMYCLIKLINSLYKEVEYLSKNNLTLNDILDNSENYIFNGQFYLIDPGYHRFKDWSYEEILEYNMRKINAFLNCYLFSYQIKDLTQILRISKDISITKYLESESNPYETLNTLVRRKK